MNTTPPVTPAIPNRSLTGMKALSEAVRLAGSLFREDKHAQEDVPYIEYLFQGVLVLWDYGVSPDVEDNVAVLVATMLRNSLEKHFGPAITLDVLQGRFGEKTAALIEDITLREDEEGDPGRFLSRIAASDWKRQIIQMVVIISESRAFARTVAAYGLVTIEECLPLPIKERIVLYRKFLVDCNLPTQHYLRMMKLDVSAELDALEKVVNSATPSAGK